MRTFTREIEERNYHVEGAIAFVFKPPLENPNLGLLRWAIEYMDSLFPWKDDQIPEGVEYKSIRYLSEGDVVIHNFSFPEQHIWFHIHPQYGSMRKSQIYAYEKYLAKLAEELVKTKLSAVDEVRSVIKTSTATTFKAS